MAFGDSVLGICNQALIALGEDPIVALTDASKRATLCAQLYDSIRRGVLRGSLWNCARVQAQLCTSTLSPKFTYTYAYQLPVDFIRLVTLPDTPNAKWELFGQNLLTDEDAPLNVVYICDLQDPTLMDPLLVQVIVYSLALAMAESLTQDMSKKQAIEVLLADKLAAARLVSSQDHSASRIEGGLLLRVRQ